MDEEETKVYENVNANEHQNTPSGDDLDRAVANDAARQLSGEEVADEVDAKLQEANQKEQKAVDQHDDKSDDSETHKDEETSKRIARLAGEARIAKREAKAANEELARLRGLAPKLEPDAEMERQINARAQQVAAMNAYNAGCDKIFEDGVKEYPDFRQIVNDINKEIGSMPVAFVEAAMEIGDPHKIIHYLGKNLDEAERIINLPPHKMGAALAKLAHKNAQIPVKQPSKAPSPIKPIAGSSRVNNQDPEKMSMDEFVKWQDKIDRERRYG